MAFLVYTQILYSSLSDDLSTFKFIHSECLIKSPSSGIFFFISEVARPAELKLHILSAECVLLTLSHRFQSRLSLSSFSSLCPSLPNIDIKQSSLSKFSSYFQKPCVPPIRSSQGKSCAERTVPF